MGSARVSAEYDFLNMLLCTGPFLLRLNALVSYCYCCETNCATPVSSNPFRVCFRFFGIVEYISKRSMLIIQYIRHSYKQSFARISNPYWFWIKKWIKILLIGGNMYVCTYIRTNVYIFSLTQNFLEIVNHFIYLTFTLINNQLSEITFRKRLAPVGPKVWKKD